MYTLEPCSNDWNFKMRPGPQVNPSNLPRLGHRAPAGCIPQDHSGPAPLLNYETVDFDDFDMDTLPFGFRTLMP